MNCVDAKFSTYWQKLAILLVKFRRTLTLCHLVSRNISPLISRPATKIEGSAELTSFEPYVFKLHQTTLRRNENCLVSSWKSGTEPEPNCDSRTR